MLCKLLFFSFAAIGLVAGQTMRRFRQQMLQDLLQKECKKYGAEDKVPELMAATDEFSDCIVANIELLDFITLRRASSAEVPEAVLRFARRLCNKKSELEVCLFKVLDAALLCAEPESRDKTDVHKAALQELGNYTCDNIAQIVSDLFEVSAIQCIEGKAVRLQLCLMNVETVDLETLSTAQACQKYTEFRSCIVDTLKQCPKPTMADYVAKILDTVTRGSRCDNSPSTSNSGSNIISNRCAEDDDDEELMQIFGNTIEHVVLT